MRCTKMGSIQTSYVKLLALRIKTVNFNQSFCLCRSTNSNIGLIVRGTPCSIICLFDLFLLTIYWWANDLVIDFIPEKSIIIFGVLRLFIYSNKSSALCLNAKLLESLCCKDSVNSFDVVIYLDLLSLERHTNTY